MDDDPVESLRIFRRLPPRPTYEDMERAFALMRDRISARLDLGLPARRWSCGVRRRGFRWVGPGC